MEFDTLSFGIGLIGAFVALLGLMAIVPRPKADPKTRVTRRDLFASSALKGLLANTTLTKHEDLYSEDSNESLAHREEMCIQARRFADTLIREIESFPN